MEQKDSQLEEKKQEHVNTKKLYNKVRLTLCERNGVKQLNFSIVIVLQVSKRILEKAKELNLKVKGPVRLPVKSLTITTRKTPCGEGSKTWDHFRMDIHKWFFDIFCSSEDIRQLISFQMGSNVTIDVTATISNKYKKLENEVDELKVDETKLIEATV